MKPSSSISPRHSAHSACSNCSLPSPRGRCRQARRLGPQPEIVDPERAGPGARLRAGRAGAELVRMLVGHLDAHVLQLRQHVRQGDGRSRPVDAQPPVAAAGTVIVAQLDGERVPRFAQQQDAAEVTDGVGGRHLGLVGVRDGRGELVQDQPGPLLAEGTHRLLFEVLLPRADRRHDPALQRRGVHGGHRAAALGAHDDVQPGQRRLPDHRAVVHRGAAQRGAQDLLDPEPDGGRVPVPGQVDQAGHVAPVGVPAQEQPGLLALAQAQHGRGDLGQLAGGDLEQFLARIVLHDLDEVVAVVTVRGDPGRGQHVGELAAQHGYPGDALGVGGVRVQAEEAPRTDHPAVPAELLDRDVVQVLVAVDGGPRVALRQHQPVRITRLGPDVGRQRRERFRALAVVPEKAEPGAGHRAQRLAVVAGHEVVLAIAQEEEMPVGEPGQQLTGFGVPAVRRRRPGTPRQRRAGVVPGHADGQGGGGRDHLRLVLDGDPYVVQDPAERRLQVGQRHAVTQAGDLDVDPRLGDVAGRRPGAVHAAGHAVQRAGHVPVHDQPGVDDQVDVRVVPVQFHRHRIDQERHVVGDDVGDGPYRPERRDRARRAGRRTGGAGGRSGDPDQGPPLRPPGGQGRVLGRDCGEPPGIERGQVLGGDVPVVGVQVTGQITDGFAQITGGFPRRAGRGRRGRGPVLPGRAGLPRPGHRLRCLIEHSVFFLVRIVRHRCLSLRIHTPRPVRGRGFPAADVPRGPGRPGPAPACSRISNFRTSRGTGRQAGGAGRGRLRPPRRAP